MQQLIQSTTAYKIYCGDVRADKVSHAYMLYFADALNLRDALKLFAVQFFGAGKEEEGLIKKESFSDLTVFPLKGGKLGVDAAAAIVDDSVIKPVAHDRKLYVISEFESSSAIFQNKLLKVLEEPPEGVYFLLGATSLAPVLDTVKSRVKLLEIPPFSTDEIYAALEREESTPKNIQAAKASGGILGVAQSIVGSGWFKEVKAAAEEICSAGTRAKALSVAARYGDFKYKKELLAQMQRIYFTELKRYLADENYVGRLGRNAVVFAVNRINTALKDIKFNANFSSLLYDFTLKVAAENEK